MKLGTGRVLTQVGFSGGRVDITRSEFNGLGKRVSDDREDFVQCRAQNTEKLENVEKTMTHIETNVGKLFDGQSEIKDSQSKMQGKIIGGVAAAVFLIQVIIALATRFL